MTYPSPHRYTHPSSSFTPPELNLEGPGSGVIEAPPAEGILAGYGLELYQAIEVELLVTGAAGGGRLVEGTVVDATTNALVVEAKAGRRTTRLPWTAVALIRDALTDHPGH